METKNYLKHKISTKDSDGNFLDIEIRLSDDCKNGHNDFAITASAYDKRGKGSHSDKYWLYGGCSHDEILKVRPDLKIFVDLHLSDFRGVPMYAVENGFFHLTEGKLNYSQSTVRATDSEFEILKTAKDKDYFGHLLVKLGIVDRWQREAKQAISILEEMTGNKFEDNSTRLPALPVFSEETEKRIASGYYSAEKIQDRENEKAIARKLKKEKELFDQRDKIIEKANNECNVKIAVLNTGMSLENFIYYDHTNVGNFNLWDWCKKVSKEEFDNFVATVDYSRLPEGIKFTIGNKGK